MRLTLLLVFLATFHQLLYAQKVTKTDGDWSKQFLVLNNTAEASLMIRVGDIDNLGFSFENNYNPFSGRPTYSHSYPWPVKKENATGTDRIMIPSSYKYGSYSNTDGYTSTTKRPENNPIKISIPLAEVKNIKADSADLQLFIDDFQAPSMKSKFQVKINGLRFTEAENIINRVNQTGPIGKLITIRLTSEMLGKLNADSLIISIDDPTTKIGDGFAVDFVKLLINPKYIYLGNVRGKIIDQVTRQPISGAMASVGAYGTAVTDNEGNFVLENIPAGLNIVKGSATGYTSNEVQADVFDGNLEEQIEIELKQSGKVIYNNKTLQEGDDLVLNNIQFAVNSAALLSEGKNELNKLVALMNGNEMLEILLSGHTSAEGSAILNRELSLKRVRSCKDYLVSKGIDDGRITIKGYGPDLPIASNDSEPGRAKNRRVELKITKL